MVSLHDYFVNEIRYISGPVEEEMGEDQNLQKRFLPFKQAGLQYRYVKCLWIALCLMLGKSNDKTKQYRTLYTTLIKILFNKSIATQVTNDISFTEKPGNWYPVAKCVKNTCERKIFQANMQVLDLYLYSKCHSSTGVFKLFFGANELPGFSLSRKLVRNGLTETLKLTATKMKIHIYF